MAKPTHETRIMIKHAWSSRRILHLDYKKCIDPAQFRKCWQIAILEQLSLPPCSESQRHQVVNVSKETLPAKIPDAATCGQRSKVAPPVVLDALRDVAEKTALGNILDLSPSLCDIQTIRHSLRYQMRNVFTIANGPRFVPNRNQQPAPNLQWLVLPLSAICVIGFVISLTMGYLTRN